MDSISDKTQPSQDETHAVLERGKNEPLTGVKTAVLISKMYGVVSPDIGVHFIEPSVVLTVAGMKASGDLNMIVRDKKSAYDQIQNMKGLVEPSGVRIGCGRILDNNKTPLPTYISNLKGYEVIANRITKLRERFPSIPPFSGEGFSWINSVEDALSRQVADGVLSQASCETILDGIALGYPDQAIIDFEDWYKTGNMDHGRLVSSDIISAHVLAQKYHGAAPEFYYYPTSLNDPGITQNIAGARQILKEFYDSSWMQDLSRNTIFLSAREQSEREWQQYLETKWRQDKST